MNDIRRIPTNTTDDSNLESDSPPPQPSSEALLAWTTRSLEQPLRDINLGPVVMMLIPTLICLGITWYMWDNIHENLDIWLAICGIAYGLFLISLMMTRQKTVFNYRITKNGAEVEKYLYFPKFATPMFKSPAIAIVILFVSVAVFTGSLAFMIGPIAMALSSARFFINWKNEVKNNSVAWSTYDLVIIDQDRLMVIATCTSNPLFGFNMRLPNKETLHDCLKIMHELLPESVEYRVERWPW
jgi:hypothetical protein